MALERVESQYTATETAHLDRLVFLMGTMRAAKNNACFIFNAAGTVMRFADTLPERLSTPVSLLFAWIQFIKGV